mmetsp:Transcript_31952/g.71962  ORF Transcript_31952/g.71962 Transcript_31952/m.71962 type:complete len:285 (+) Transcript_31952:383-1237(+)
MDRVVFGAHDGFGVPHKGIVDVGGPDGGEEKHEDVRQVVTRHHEQHHHVRGCLQDSVERVEGDGSPGAQLAALPHVILVVEPVHVRVQPLVGVQGSVHPVDAHLHHREVEQGQPQVVGPAAHLLYRPVHLGVPFLDEPLAQDWQGGIHKQGNLRQRNLVPHDGRARPFVGPLLGEELLPVDRVGPEVPEPRHRVVHGGPGHQVPRVSHRVVRPLPAQLPLIPRQRRRRENQAVYPLVKSEIRVVHPFDLRQWNIEPHKQNFLERRRASSKNSDDKEGIGRRFDH